MNKYKLGLSIILLCSIIDAFAGSVPFIGTVSNVTFELIQGLTAIWLLR